MISSWKALFISHKLGYIRYVLTSDIWPFPNLFLHVYLISQENVDISFPPDHSYLWSTYISMYVPLVLNFCAHLLHRLADTVCRYLGRYLALDPDFFSLVRGFQLL